MQYTHRVSSDRIGTFPHRRDIHLLAVIAILAVCVLWLPVIVVWPVVRAKASTSATIPNALQQDPTQPQVGPGLPLVGSNGPRRAASSNKAGSLLFFHKYTSDPSSPSTVNTLLTITNSNPRDSVTVPVFSVHAPSIEDVCLTIIANQSRTLTGSKESLGGTGYAFAIAVNSQGLPTQFNWLLGNASFRDSRSHEASHNAFAVSKRSA